MTFSELTPSKSRSSSSTHGSENVDHVWPTMNPRYWAYAWRSRNWSPAPAKSPSKNARTSSWPPGVRNSTLMRLARAEMFVRLASPDVLGWPTGIELVRKRSSVPSGSSVSRSEERRVGKECRSRGAPCDEKKKRKQSEVEDRRETRAVDK